MQKKYVKFSLKRNFYFDDSPRSQNLRVWESISPKNILIFPEDFFDFKMDSTDKQSIINLWRYNSKGYASGVFREYQTCFYSYFILISNIICIWQAVISWELNRLFIISV